MRQEEHRHQAALFRWAALASAHFPELAMLYAVPNGGHRHKAVAARMKAEGVKSGVPDICLPVPCNGCHGMYIELKSGRGRPTPQQRRWIAALSRMGYRALVCHGWETAREAIEEYLGMGSVVPDKQQGGDHEGDDVRNAADVCRWRARGRVPRPVRANRAGTGHG